MSRTIVGVEVGKTSVLCCTVSEAPENPAEFARSYTPVLLSGDASGIKRLLELGDCFVLEPTGDYSRLWTEVLRAGGKEVLRVSPNRVKALKSYHGISSKTDRYDAAFLAIYGLLNQGSPTAFLGDHAEDLREATLRHQFVTRMTTNLQRRLWQLLSHEWPEVCRSKSGTKPQQNREWLEESPPALWRFVAGEKVSGQKRREAQLEATVGSGLSDLSRVIAAQICEMERQQVPIEKQIAAMLEASEFKPYHTVFDRFGFGELTRAIILSRIYPFSQFLGPDGRPRREKSPSSKVEGRYHRRDRSLGAFRLALGNGTRSYQSGQIDSRKAAGSKVARSALFLHVKVKVVILGGRVDAPDKLRGHIALYRSLGEMPHKQAVGKVMSRVVKDLYRELLATL